MGFANVTTITSDVICTSTDVVTAYTTYCPVATSWVENNSTIVVTEPSTVTVTNCPCTREKTYTTKTTTVCPQSEVPSPGPTGSSQGTSPKPTTVAPESSAPPAPPAETTMEQGAGSAITLNGALAGVAAVAAYLL